MDKAISILREFLWLCLCASNIFMMLSVVVWLHSGMPRSQQPATLSDVFLMMAWAGFNALAAFRVSRLP